MEKEEIIKKLKEELDEYLHGLVICDYITRNEQSEILNDFDNWSSTAEYGDTYYHDGREYTLKAE